jgi:hypothetical protein
MSEHRKPLDLSKLNLAPAPQTAAPRPEPLPLYEPAAWPSRESRREVQINIRAPEEVIQRFKDLAYWQRLNQAKALEFLLDFYDRHKGT